MWRYEKRLQYPVKISQPNPKMAQFIMSQYGGAYAVWYSFSLVLSYVYRLLFKFNRYQLLRLVVNDFID